MVRSLLLLNLVASCTRPNPGFDSVGGTTRGDPSSSSTSTSASASTTAETSASPTVTSDATTTTTTTGGVTSDTTGLSLDPSSSSTGPILPACALSDRGIQVDLALNQTDCEKKQTVYFRVSKLGEEANAQLCPLKDCAEPCLFTFPLGPELSPFVADKQCYRVLHQGKYLPFDPEIATDCKTIALAIFAGQEIVYPLFAGFSRVPAAPPGFLDPDVTLSGTLDRGTPCACDETQCCEEQTATTHRFQIAGLDLAPGDSEPAVVKGVDYSITLLRAQLSGSLDPNNTCVPSPEGLHLDWTMLKFP